MCTVLSSQCVKTMSLGMLGDYGSGSEISDSDGEFEQASSDRNDNQTKSDTTTSKTEPLVDTCSSANEGESKSAGKEGDPLSYYIQDDASSSDSHSSSDEGTPSGDKDTAVPLPLPDLDQLTTSPTGQGTTTFRSVFSNPYKEAEEAKLAMLKHHVSDFAPDKKSSQQERTKHHKFKGSRGSKRSRAPRHGSELASDAMHTLGVNADPQRLFNDDDSCVVVGEVAHGGMKRKQRSGVSSTLVPPKKYLKSYGKAQAEERPWTVRTESQRK